MQCKLLKLSLGSCLSGSYKKTKFRPNPDLSWWLLICRADLTWNDTCVYVFIHTINFYPCQHTCTCFTWVLYTSNLWASLDLTYSCFQWRLFAEWHGPLPNFLMWAHLQLLTPPPPPFPLALMCCINFLLLRTLADSFLPTIHQFVNCIFILV